jgi:hypothetical protein
LRGEVVSARMHKGRTANARYIAGSRKRDGLLIEGR